MILSQKTRMVVFAGFYIDGMMVKTVLDDQLGVSTVGVFFIQAYHLHKFSEYANVQFEAWYSIGSESEADYANATYTGLQWELEHKPVIRCADDEVMCQLLKLVTQMS